LGNEEWFSLKNLLLAEGAERRWALLTCISKTIDGIFNFNIFNYSLTLVTGFIF